MLAFCLVPVVFHGRNVGVQVSDLPLAHQRDLHSHCILLVVVSIRFPVPW